MSNCERSPIERQAMQLWQDQYDEIGYSNLGLLKMKNRRWGCNDDLILAAIVTALQMWPPEK